MPMKELSDSGLVKIHLNAHHTFFLNQKIISTYSGKLNKIINQQKKRSQRTNSEVEINGFPGGEHAFELISRFCYNNGRIHITPSNASLLHCSSIFLDMTEDFSPCNLLHQTRIFLDGLFYWSWNDVLSSLKNCESFISCPESSPILNKLISSLLSKITQNSDFEFSSSLPPETAFTFPSSTKVTSDSIKPSSSTKAWWFDDLSILAPKTIEMVIKIMGCYGTHNHSLVLTKFLLHYLKTAVYTKGGIGSGPNWYSDCAGLADTAVYGMVLLGKSSFSCRGLFWVLRIVSGLGLSKDCRAALEGLIGRVLEQATLDDLLVPGHAGVAVYDVNLVLRLVRVFVNGGDSVSVQRMKRVGRLVDKYIGEISPDQNLKISKFLAVAESLPDAARDSSDGVYRAIDIYLESHQKLSLEERSKLCRCLDYQKLSPEAYEDLAKNPQIPPRISLQALASQKPKVQASRRSTGRYIPTIEAETDKFLKYSEKNEETKLNLQRMQWRVMELEKFCREIKSQKSKKVKNKIRSTPAQNTALPTTS